MMRARMPATRPRSAFALSALWLLACVAAPVPPPASPPPAAEAAVEDRCPGLIPADLKQARAWMTQRAAETRLRAGTATHAIVVANDARAAEIGLATLRAGGNAADAFVATALAETVIYPGVTSIAGFMHVLYYDAGTRHASYIVGGHRVPRDPAAGQPHRGSDPVGRSVAVPGAAFGFATLVARFGRRPLAEATRAAAALARDGFYVNDLYASIVGSRVKVLERTPYARAVYLPGGRPVLSGDTLRLPAYADTLDRFGGEGAAFFARGAWARDFVDQVNAEGGKVSLDDLADAHGEELPPVAWHHDDVDFVLASGPALGGSARVIFGLELADSFGKLPAPFSPEWASTMLRVYAESVGETAWLEGADLLSRAADLPARVTARAHEAARTAPALAPMSRPNSTPHHSSAVVVVDADGNIAVGMHTINDYPFGAGIFVGGVPLATSLPLPTVREKTPGSALPVSISPILALRGGVPVFALAQFNAGGFPADVEVTSAVLDGGLPLAEAVTGPRVASIHPGELHDGKPEIVVDPRYPTATLCALAASLGASASLEADVRGILASEGSLDAVTIGSEGEAPHLSGIAAEILHGRVLGY